MNSLLRTALVTISGGRLGRRLMAEANAARDREDWREAEQLYGQALARKPGLAFVLVQLGYVTHRSGRARDALAIWFDYLRRPETGRETHANLLTADLLSERGNPAAAEFHYDRASAEPGRRRLSAYAEGANGTEAALGALATCEADLCDVDRLDDCAGRLDGLGFVREAGLLRNVAAVRRGRARPSAGDTISEVCRDLAEVQAALPADPLPVDAATFLSIAAVRSPDSAATSLAPDDVLDQAVAIANGLNDALVADDAPAGLDILLERIRSSLVDAPPLVSLGADETVAMRTGRVAWNSLRHFLLRHRFLAYFPTGSGALLRAAAGCSWAGIGPYLDGAPRILGNGSDVFGWLRLAWFSEEGEVSTELIELGAILLGSQLRLTPTNFFVEELGDLGFVRAVGGILSHRLACGDATRLLLERARDAYLDADAAAPARDVQSVIVADWRDDPNEQSILADLRAMTARGVRPSDREVLEQRFARDTLRCSLRLARQARVANGALDFSAEAEGLAVSLGSPGLAPEIAPVAPNPEGLNAGMEILHLGWRKGHSHWGSIPVLRGIEAVRIRCTSWHAVSECRLFLDGRRIAQVRNDNVGLDGVDPPFRSTFNVWVDLSAISPGPHFLEIVCVDVLGARISQRRRVQIEDPYSSEAVSLSNAAIVLPTDSNGSLDQRINAQPSLVRSAGRSFFGILPRRVLVMRADQLGDFVASVPAIRRLREMLPDAEIYALVTPANETLARSLGIFADVITAELIFNHATRRRDMQIGKQAVLRDRLVALGLDLAIDLSPAPDSRPLLKLSGAPYLIGFKPIEFPWLTFGIDARTRDGVNGKDRASHSTIVLSLVEAVGTTLRSRFATVPDMAIRRDALERFGLAADTRFAVLHAGARLDFKRWPLDSYIDLARLIVERTDLNVVLLSDHAADSDRVHTGGISRDRLSFAGGNLPSDEFESLIGFCEVFVGNDTGPKHLAAFRGAKVVSVHMGQVNWDEWGQEGNGLIVSRRVPCCGCGIDRTADCGKDLACLVHIRPDEVFGAVERLLAQSGTQGAEAAIGN